MVARYQLIACLDEHDFWDTRGSDRVHLRKAALRLRVRIGERSNGDHQPAVMVL